MKNNDGSSPKLKITNLLYYTLGCEFLISSNYILYLCRVEWEVFKWPCKFWCELETEFKSYIAHSDSVQYEVKKTVYVMNSIFILIL